MPAGTPTAYEPLMLCINSSCSASCSLLPTIVPLCWGEGRCWWPCAVCDRAVGLLSCQNPLECSSQHCVTCIWRERHCYCPTVLAPVEACSCSALPATHPPTCPPTPTPLHAPITCSASALLLPFAKANRSRFMYPAGPTTKLVQCPEGELQNRKEMVHENID